MNAKEAQIHRTAMAAQRIKEEFADEIRRGLLLLRYAGQCKCGLMLTDRDRTSAKKETYCCPHCGVSQLLAEVA